MISKLNALFAVQWKQTEFSLGVLSASFMTVGETHVPDGKKRSTQSHSASLVCVLSSCWMEALVEKRKERAQNVPGSLSCFFSVSSLSQAVSKRLTWISRLWISQRVKTLLRVVVVGSEFLKFGKREKLRETFHHLFSGSQVSFEVLQVIMICDQRPT